MRFHVLIETLWNVKQTCIRIWLCCRFGINRNIVECKDTSPLMLRASPDVLIETLWNVK